MKLETTKLCPSNRTALESRWAGLILKSSIHPINTMKNQAIVLKCTQYRGRCGKALRTLYLSGCSSQTEEYAFTNVTSLMWSYS